MSKEALKLALSKIKSARDCHPNAVQELIFEAEELLEQALAAPVQEPVAWDRPIIYTPPHMAPPAAQRPWVDLTDEQRSAIIRHHSFADDIIKVTTAKLKELNT